MNAFGRQLSAASTHASRTCRRRVWNDGCVLPFTSRRSMHVRRDLQYPIENGVGDFLPPSALKTVVEWQDGLLERLNEQVKGTQYANQPVLQTIIDTAADEEKIKIYNYACLAANNSFFLDSLKPPADGRTSNIDEMSNDLEGVILTQFKDVDDLSEYFVASASGMASSGWLWLVTDGQQRLAVVPTFGAGTLLVRSRVQVPGTEQTTLARQAYNIGRAPSTPSSPVPSSPGPSSSSGVFPPLRDSPPRSSPASGVSSTPPPLNPHTPSRSFHFSGFNANYSTPSVTSAGAYNAADSVMARKELHAIGSRLYPLFCLSVHEHAWMSAGLGVWGKDEYVRRFFSVVNWKRVSETYMKFQRQTRHV